ncbi:hypothetical protein C8Q75DRAFT_753378 [Abortiporus biennis]|nr:hypothetical protein C8Q75DRAFT_753378 [Abortiporus biennis]
MCSKDFHLPQALDLRKLRHLELKNSADFISTFMNNIAIPDISKIDLRPTNINQPLEFDFRQILPSDLSSIPIVQSVDTVCLGWASTFSSTTFIVSGISKELPNAGGSFRLVAPCTSQAPRLPQSDELPIIHSPKTSTLGEHTKFHLTRTLFNIFRHSFFMVRKLSLTGVFDGLTLEDWTRFLENLPNVEHIIWKNLKLVQQNTVHKEIPFLNALSQEVPSNIRISSSMNSTEEGGVSQCYTRKSEPVVLCPNLRILSLRFFGIVQPSFEEVVLEKLQQRVLICKGRKLGSLCVRRRRDWSCDETWLETYRLRFQGITEKFSLTLG